MSNLLSVAELQTLLTGARPVRLVDVRWSLTEPDGHAAYLAGHLPGAVWADLERELAQHGEPVAGRHPLPALGDLEQAARRWGMCGGDMVVAYDDFGGLAAARAWWLLRRAGVEVRVLDGGLQACRAAGLPVEAGDVVPTPGDVVLAEASGDTLSIDEAAAFPDSGVLIDARAPERYRGDVEPMDPIAGHIPGAVNVPFGALVNEGRLRPVGELREVFAAARVEDGVLVAAYCGSGVTAAHTALALAELGIRASIFPGSWSAWSNTPGRPIALGDTPAADVVAR